MGLGLDLATPTAETPSGTGMSSLGGTGGGGSAHSVGGITPSLTPFSLMNSMEWPSPRGATPIGGFSPGPLTAAGYHCSSFQDLVVKGTAIGCESG